MSSRIGVANGQGKCRECARPILKGEKQLIEEEWMKSGRLCKNCSLKPFASLFSEEILKGKKGFYDTLKALVMLNNLEETNE